MGKNVLNQETKIGPNHCFTFRKYCKWFKYTCGYMFFYGYFFFTFFAQKKCTVEWFTLLNKLCRYSLKMAANRSCEFKYGTSSFKICISSPWLRFVFPKSIVSKELVKKIYCLPCFVVIFIQNWAGIGIGAPHHDSNEYL